MNRLIPAISASILAMFVFFPSESPAQTPAAKPTQTEATRQFRVYLEQDWSRWMHEYPEKATGVGFPGENRRWDDNSPAGYEAHEKHLRESLKNLTEIPRSLLPHSEQLNYDLWRELLETAKEGLNYGDDPMPVHDVVPGNRWLPLNQMDGIQDSAAQAFASMPKASVADYEDILARLEALPPVVDQVVLNLQAGLKQGYSPPRITLRDVPKQVLDVVPDDPMKSALLEPFADFPPAITEADRVRLTSRARHLYSAGVAPAFRRLHDYLVASYIPACRENIAASALPNGAEAYAFHIRWQTTTALTAAQIHEIGLSEVKRIHAEMDKLIASTGFKGSYKEFTDFLRSDPQFYFDKTDDLVNGYRIITKKIDPALAHEFGKLPRLPYGVIPIPDFKAPSQTTAYYEPGAPTVGRPGYFFVNTYNLKARPKWEMEALSLHESVPGHHLQISLAQELEGAPEFRKQGSYSAFVEGWGLYAESLGEELGMYKDPYSKFGQLTYEMWRAVRLVVDTGMHSQGWSRSQAIDFFRENTGKTDQDISVEVDRYIVWPGQALAYKLGQLKIRELRTHAEQTLGEMFDVRKFNDAVLEQGALPLNLLESHMNEWLRIQEAVSAD